MCKKITVLFFRKLLSKLSIKKKKKIQLSTYQKVPIFVTHRCFKKP